MGGFDYGPMWQSEWNVTSCSSFQIAYSGRSKTTLFDESPSPQSFPMLSQLENNITRPSFTQRGKTYEKEEGRKQHKTPSASSYIDFKGLVQRGDVHFGLELELGSCLWTFDHLVGYSLDSIRFVVMNVKDVSSLGDRLTYWENHPPFWTRLNSPLSHRLGSCGWLWFLLELASHHRKRRDQPKWQKPYICYATPLQTIQ